MHESMMKGVILHRAGCMRAWITFVSALVQPPASLSCAPVPPRPRSRASCCWQGGVRADDERVITRGTMRGSERPQESAGGTLAAGKTDRSFSRASRAALGWRARKHDRTQISNAYPRTQRAFLQGIFK